MSKINKQSAAAEFNLKTATHRGTNLIEASAGTGKTYNISRLFLRFLLEPEERGVDAILTVTFTRAAAAELRERIRALLGEALEATESYLATGKLPDEDEFIAHILTGEDSQLLNDTNKIRERLITSLRDFDKASIYTIHGFCKKVLQDFSFETGVSFNTEYIEQQQELLEEVATDFWRENFYNEEPLFIQHALKCGVTPAEMIAMLLVAQRYPAARFALEVSDTTVDYEKFTNCCLNSLAITREDRRTIRGVIQSALDGSVLNKTKFTAKRVEAFYAALEQLSIGEQELSLAAFQLIDAFLPFTESKLREGTRKNQKTPEHPFFSRLEQLSEIHSEFAKQLNQRLLFRLQKFFEECRDKLAERKKQENLLHFDDLIAKLHSAVKTENNHIRQKLQESYRVALIDEFQDTDDRQWEIFSSIFNSERQALFLIGDPKQSIYSFRGGDIHTYLRAASSADNRFTLKVNQRSTELLLNGLNTLFLNRNNPFLLENIEYLPISAAGRADKNPLTLASQSEPPLNFWSFNELQPEEGMDVESAEAFSANAVVNEISRLLQPERPQQAMIGSRPVRAGDIAILVRSNVQAQQMHKLLQESGLNSVVLSDESVFDSLEAEELAIILTAIYNPGNSGLTNRALATEIMGYSAKDVAEINDSITRTAEIQEQFNRYRELRRSSGFMPMFKLFLDQNQVEQKLLLRTNGERIITNLLHLGEILHRHTVESNTSELTFLSRLLGNRYRQEDEHQIRLASDEDTIQVVTVHKSKGLEYNIVFCPFPWSFKSRKISELLAHQSSGKTLYLPPSARKITGSIAPPPFNSEQSFENIIEQMEHDSLAEELRLFYVALTRAIHRCYVPLIKLNRGGKDALSYLLGDYTPKSHSTGDSTKKMSSLSELAGQNPEAIALSPPPADRSAIGCDSTIKAALQLHSLNFTGSIASDYRLSSFTSIQHGQTSDESSSRDVEDSALDRESLFVERATTGDGSTEQNSFTFPAGAESGNFFHSIFETYFMSDRGSDFNLEKEIRQAAKRYDLSDWVDTASEIINRVLDAPLLPDDPSFSLRQLRPRDCVAEINFYLPLQQINRGDLEAALPEKLRKLYGEQLTNLNFNATSGFLMGFVDLIFRWRDRFYLLDWKSNRLGSTVSDYQSENMEEAMQRSGYNLQYYLYLAALQGYLRQRWPGYSYDSNFGDVFYLFIRGISATDSESGIYRSRPDENFLKVFEQLLHGEES